MNLKKKLLMMSLAASMVVPSNLALVAGVATPVFAEEFKEEFDEVEEVIEDGEASSSVSISNLTDFNNYKHNSHTGSQNYWLPSGTYKLNLSTPQTLTAPIAIEKDTVVTIDLGNSTVNLDKDMSYGFYICEGGTLNIKGKGTITNSAKADVQSIVFYTLGDLNIGEAQGESEVKITTRADSASSNVWAIGLLESSKGSKLNKSTVNLYSGTEISTTSGLTVNGLITDQTKGNYPTIKLSEATFNTPNLSIYQAGYSDITINDSNLKSGTTAIETRAGKLTVNSGTITGGDGTTTVESNGNGSTTENAGIAVAPHTTAKDIDVQIKGGTVEGAIPVVITDPENKGGNNLSVSVAPSVNLTSSNTDGYQIVYSESLANNESISKIKDSYFKCGKANIENNNNLKIKDDSVKDLFDGKLGRPAQSEDGTLVYTLTEDVTLDKQIVFPATSKVKIDLAGFTLSSKVVKAGTSKEPDYVDGWALKVPFGATLDIENGVLDVLQNAIAVYGSLNAENVNFIFGSQEKSQRNGWGVGIYSGSTEVNIKSSTFTGYAGLTTNGQIKKENYPTVVLDTVTMDCTNMAIYDAGYSNLVIKNSVVKGEKECGIETRAGILNVEDSEIIGGENTLKIVENDNGSTAENVGISIAQHVTKNEIKVTVKNSKVSGFAALAVSNPEKNSTSKIVEIEVSNSILNGKSYDIAYTQGATAILNKLDLNGNIFLKNKIQKLDADLKETTSVDGEYTLTKKNGTEGTLVLEGTGPYDVNATPAITGIQVGDLALPQDLYSDPQYSGNTTSGTATVTLTPTEDNLTFGTALSATYEVKDNSTPVTPDPVTPEPTSITGATITLAQNSFTYTGNAIEPTVASVTLDGTPLSETDYEVSYSNNVELGIGTVTITGKGNYTGTATTNFSIVEATTVNPNPEEPTTPTAPEDPTPENPVAKKEIVVGDLTLDAGPYTLSDGTNRPGVTVTVDGETLTKDVDYTVTYEECDDLGDAIITVTGIGNYTGVASKIYVVIDDTDGVVNIVFGNIDEDVEETSVDIPEQYFEGDALVVSNDSIAVALTNQSADPEASEGEYAPAYIYHVDGFEDSSYLTTPEITFDVNRDSVIRLVLEEVEELPTPQGEMAEVLEDSELHPNEVVIYATLDELDNIIDNDIVTKDEVEAYIASKPEYSNAQVPEDFHSQDFRHALNLSSLPEGMTMSEDGFIEIFAVAEVASVTNTKPSGGSGSGGGSVSKPNTPEEPSNPIVGKPTTMYRLYNRLTGEHLYTTDKAERDNLLTSDTWKDEGQGWTAPDVSDYPVYRLLNPNNGDHHYTTDKNEFETLPSLGWVAEGIAFFSADKDDAENVILYRLYNPNAKGAGSHHYTVDEAEKDALVKLGWKYEGTAWAGLKSE